MQDESGIQVNTRILSHRLSGAQRYLTEILACLPQNITRIAPEKFHHGGRGHLWEQGILPALFRGGKGSVLWSPSITGPLLVRRQVVTCFDTSVFDVPDDRDPTFVKFYKWLMPKLYPRVEKIIAISEFTRKQIVRHTGVPYSKVEMISCGVSDRFHPHDAQAIIEMRTALKIPRDRPYILSLCTLQPAKNLSTLLAAWQQLENRISDDVMLILAGGSGKSDVYSKLDLNHVPRNTLLTGHVNDALLPALIAGARGFVFPSRYEGFGLPPLEAMASGTPVISSNATSLPEVVGDAGILLDPNKPHDFAAAILSLVEDDRLHSDLARKGLERAKMFPWSSAGEQTHRLLRAVLG
ncbi:mannosyltransferase [Aliidongia dinghuensis]|uniref:Mannosyltransferase n=1 Tax=Aliidongia dinghuensis TaxID=1867774 RepID=A0A8J2YVY5_9PROT|nr:glycosyltransferase family 1 protein [Aliidongia dinghuensis]GGF27533.1 mannosyltransferase [Aliidongia dinghuensis]